MQRRRPSRVFRLCVMAAVAATLVLYLWTALGGLRRPPPISGRQTDYFNQLAHGLASGHLYLDREVPAALTAAPDPYDPARRPDRLVAYDASYFRGHYYIYFGPAPVVTLLLPFSLLTGRDLPLPYAVWWFCSVGYLALVAAFFHLWLRYYPRAGAGTVWAGLIALSVATLAGALLRRPSFWELAIASGFAFFALALFCLIRALSSPRAARWAAAGGLALGLACASRPTYGVGAILFVLPLLGRRGRPAAAPWPTYGWRAVAAAALPSALIGVVLLLYNFGRFHDFLEFGMKYQLYSRAYRDAPHMAFAYFPFNAFVYFLAPLHWVRYFPFLAGITFPAVAPAYYGCEYCFGVLTNLPFIWFGLAGLALVWWPARRGSEAKPGRPAVLALIALAALLNALPLLFFIGSAIRYLADFVPYLMLLSAAGLWEIEARLRAPGARAVLAAAGLAAAAGSGFVAEMAIVNLYDPIAGAWPEAYRSLALILNRPVIAYEHWRGRFFGPMAVTFSFPADLRPRREVLIAAGEPATGSCLWAEYGATGRVRLAFGAGPGAPAAFSPEFAAVPGAAHALLLSMPGLYPRDATEESLADLPPGEFGRLKSWLYVSCDGVVLFDRPWPVADDSPQEVAAGREFSGQILSVRRFPALARRVPRPLAGGVRVRLRLEPGMAGRAFPLAAAGRYAAGDFLVLRVGAKGEAGFAYDHWGAPMLAGPEAAWGFGVSHVVEFWLPSIVDGDSTELTVRVDGRTVWRRTVRSFPNDRHEIYYGRNPIGGTTSEAVLENGEFESETLPPAD